MEAPSEIKVLMIGDIVGKPGRRAVETILPTIVSKENVHLVIANGENIAGGMGITRVLAEYLFAYGVDIITTGNHVFKHNEIRETLAEKKGLLRPHNYPKGEPGTGLAVIDKGYFKIAVLNLEGTIFMNRLENPFIAAHRALAELAGETSLIFVDFHAEATSEKVAMGHYLDGRVTAVFGTHTHVQTADEKILPKGTAFICDVGMTGPVDSVIGVSVKSALARFVTEQRQRFTPAKGRARMDACLVSADPASGRANSIKALQILTDL